MSGNYKTTIEVSHFNSASTCHVSTFEETLHISLDSILTWLSPACCKSDVLVLFEAILTKMFCWNNMLSTAEACRTVTKRKSCTKPLSSWLARRQSTVSIYVVNHSLCIVHGVAPRICKRSEFLSVETVRATRCRSDLQEISEIRRKKLIDIASVAL